MPDSLQAPTDTAQRFLFEEADIRGETVQLGDAYREIVATHQYAPGVRLLLGEFLAAAVLLASTLKFEGRLTLQARSAGQVPLLMAECDSALQIRGIARGAQQATAGDFEQLLTGGHLAITVDPVRGRRYQGIVPLTGNSLAHSLDAYFRQSEQLGTRLWLAADEQCATGMLLQQLPENKVREAERRTDQWEHVCTLAATVTGAELLELAPPAVLHRLYHRETVRLFAPRGVAFRCSCSRERSIGALSALPAEELEDILRERGAIDMECEFCNQQYHFERADLDEILGPDAATLH